MNTSKYTQCTKQKGMTLPELKKLNNILETKIVQKKKKFLLIQKTLT